MMRGYFWVARTISILTIGLLALGLGFTQPVHAEVDDPYHIETQWGGTLRAGGAFFSEDLDSSDLDLIINGQIFYNMGGQRGKMGHDWNLGINVDYEHHELDDTKAEIDVVTVMPFVEFRTRYDHWAPYFTTGVGINFSSVKKEPSGIDINVKNSLALKFGIGADWFITDHIAINTEAAWKYNNPDIKGKVAGSTVASGNENLSTVQVMAGLRFYFGE